MDFEKLKKLFETAILGLQSRLDEKVKAQSDLANVEIKGLKEQIDTLREAVKNANAVIEKLNKERVPGLAEEAKKKDFHIVKVMRALIKIRDGNSIENAFLSNDAGHELEVIKEYAKVKDMMAGDGSSGGFTIPHEAMLGEIIQKSIEAMPLYRFGIMELKGLTGSRLPILKETGLPTAYMVGETGAPLKSELSFSMQYLQPHKVAAYTPITNDLLYQSVLGMEAYIRRNLIREIARKIHSMILIGKGTDLEPPGALNTLGFTIMGEDEETNGKRLTFDAMLALEQAILSANELDGGSFGFLMRPEALLSLKRTTILQYSTQASADGQPLTGFNPLMSLTRIQDYIGYNMAITTALPNNYTKGNSTNCSPLIFGDWSKLLLATWRDFTLKTSEHATNADGNSAFFNDYMYILALQQFDSAIIKPTAFCKRLDVKTSW